MQYEIPDIFAKSFLPKILLVIPHHSQLNFISSFFLFTLLSLYLHGQGKAFTPGTHLALLLAHFKFMYCVYYDCGEYISL